MTVLLSNASATGAEASWTGGRGLLVLAGTVGGATIRLQYLGPDGVTWLPAATDLTAVGMVAFDLPPGRIRAAVSGGSPSGLYARADHLKG